MSGLRLALSQLNPLVGDVFGNARRITEVMAEAERLGADLVGFPELAITGYPPEDLLLKPAFIEDNVAAMEQVAKVSGRCVAVVGYVRAPEGPGQVLENALAVCHQGRIIATYTKRHLPNYAVFDEKRWFRAGTDPYQLLDIGGVLVGLSICEDLWSSDGPVVEQGLAGADLVVNCNASPYAMERPRQRLEVIRRRVEEAGCAVAYVNQVGGQDELVFDGSSVVVGSDCSVLAAAESFVEQLLIVDMSFDGLARAVELEGFDHSLDGFDRRGPARLPSLRVSNAPPDPAAASEPLKRCIAHWVFDHGDAWFLPSDGDGAEESAGRLGLIPGNSSESADPVWRREREVYSALVLGTRDYFWKNGFTDAVIGVSGGIDSALVTALAVDALGADRVHAVGMPSRYSSEGSITDAEQLAANLGVDFELVPIEALHRAYSEVLEPALGHEPGGLTDENLQSRLRGVLLMAISNDRGWIVLTTGNKSELATGYSTLYGDTAGGFAVIKDVPKTLVYRLCEARNVWVGSDQIPDGILVKPPSAELRPDQRDDQSLPDYDVLDPILAGLVEEDLSVAELIGSGYDPDMVIRVARLVDRAEYKRRQSPIGVRITGKAFGKDRRVPITNGYQMVERIYTQPAVEDTR